MDFLEGIENRYFTTYFNKRKQVKINRAVALKQKAINQPEELTWEEIRTFMRGLKYSGELETSQEAIVAQKQFQQSAAVGVFPAFIMSMTPLLVKETYKLKALHKFCLFSGVFGICYTVAVYPSLQKLKEENRKIVHEKAKTFNPKNQ